MHGIGCSVSERVECAQRPLRVRAVPCLLVSSGYYYRQTRRPTLLFVLIESGTFNEARVVINCMCRVRAVVAQV
jgi:hypothetical protein